jgi:amino acid permease
MKIKLVPAIKGLITAILMIIVALIIFYTNQPVDSKLEYLVYIIYAGGITWTLLSYRQSDTYTGKFGDLFNQGFRCFIVVTLSMVIFTAAFSKLHPEFAEEAGENYRKELVMKGNKTDAEIDEIVKNAKKQYTLQLISMAIFGYLIIGAIATVAVSAFLTKRN